MTNKITSPKYKLFVDNKSFYEETVKFIQITNPEFLTDQKPKLQAINACKMILSIANIKYNETYLNNKQIFQFYYLNHLTGLYKELDLHELGKLVHILVDALKCIVDLKKLSLDLLFFLETGNKEVMNIDKLNLAPSHYCKFLNGIYSLKDNKFYKSGSNEFKKLMNKYDFVSRFNFDFITVNENDDKLIIYNKFKKDLANGDSDLEQIFDELVYATAEGNGRKRYFMLSGQAGSGKTTFGNILKHIAGENYTQYITMDAFSDPNSLNTLDLSTKIVIGDDLQKSAKLVGPALRYFKTLIDQNMLSLPVKYEANRLVQTKAVWLQFMNDNPNIYEANDAIIDRTALIYIKGKNHRKEMGKVEREFARRLDELTGKTGKADKEFIQKIVCSTISKLDYFYDFTLTDKMISDTTEMVNDANWAVQFIEWLDSYELFNFSKIPTTDISVLLDRWIIESNAKMIKPAARTISKEMIPLMIKYGYELDTTRPRINTKDLISYNRDIIEDEFKGIKYKLTASKSSHWIKNDTITKTDVNNYLTKFDNEILPLNYDDLSMKDKIITRALIQAGNIDVTSWYIQQDLN